MRLITVARKPLSEPSVAANVLVHGTGAINIDKTRVGFVSEEDEAEAKLKNQHAAFGSAKSQRDVYGDYSMVPVVDYNPPGRWPANLILQHLPECQQEGTREIKGPAVDGRVTNAVWVCVSGCPVSEFDLGQDTGGASRFFKQVKP